MHMSYDVVLMSKMDVTGWSSKLGVLQRQYYATATKLADKDKMIVAATLL